LALSPNGFLGSTCTSVIVSISVLYNYNCYDYIDDDDGNNNNNYFYIALHYIISLTTTTTTTTTAK